MSNRSSQDQSERASLTGFHVVPSSSMDPGDDAASLSTDIEQHTVGSEVDDEQKETAPTQWQTALSLLGSSVSAVVTPALRVVFAPRAQRAMVNTAVMTIAFAWVLLTSIAAYWAFYQNYVPRVAHTEPVYFQYGLPPSEPPVGIVDLTRGTRMAPLRHEQAYDVSVQLHVPTSDINFDIGNFMITAELQTADGETIARSSRPAILRYQSSAQRILHVFAKALPLLLGLAEESQTISVLLIEGYLEKNYKPASRVIVTLSNPRLQVYDALADLKADFRGLRYYMYHRWIATAMTFTIIFIIIELLCTAIAWKMLGEKLWLRMRDYIEETVPNAEKDEDEDQLSHAEENTDIMSATT